MVKRHLTLLAAILLPVALGAACDRSESLRTDTAEAPQSSQQAAAVKQLPFRDAMHALAVDIPLTVTLPADYDLRHLPEGTFWGLKSDLEAGVRGSSRDWTK